MVRRREGKQKGVEKRARDHHTGTRAKNDVVEVAQTEVGGGTEAWRGKKEKEAERDVGRQNSKSEAKEKWGTQRKIVP